ncbi:unnamed protein product [Boreogadus saida]
MLNDSSNSFNSNRLLLSHLSSGIKVRCHLCSEKEVIDTVCRDTAGLSEGKWCSDLIGHRCGLREEPGGRLLAALSGGRTTPRRFSWRWSPMAVSALCGGSSRPSVKYDSGQIFFLLPVCSVLTEHTEILEGIVVY